MPSDSDSSDDGRSAAKRRQRKLVRAVEKGRTKKVQSLLRKHLKELRPALAAPLGRHGGTLLHAAARDSADAALLRALLAAGADINAIDNNGRTAVHVASAAAVQVLLREARLCGQQIDLGLRDRRGVSVCDAIQGGAGSATSGGARSERASGRSERARWEARLREEAADEEGHDAFYGGFDDDGGGVADGDDWFGQIAAERSARANAARDAARAEAAARDERRESERLRRQRAAEAERAAREEQHRLAERRAQLEVGKAAREAYADGWRALGERAAAKPLKFGDIPWPCRGGAPRAGRALGRDDVEGVLVAHLPDAAARRRALRAEIGRWHPDKFTQRWGRKLDAAARDQILEGVTQVAQLLNELLAALPAGAGGATTAGDHGPPPPT